MATNGATVTNGKFTWTLLEMPRLLDGLMYGQRAYQASAIFHAVPGSAVLREKRVMLKLNESDALAILNLGTLHA